MFKKRVFRIISRCQFFDAHANPIFVSYEFLNLKILPNSK